MSDDLSEINDAEGVDKVIVAGNDQKSTALCLLTGSRSPLQIAQRSRWRTWKSMGGITRSK